MLLEQSISVVVNGQFALSGKSSVLIIMFGYLLGTGVVIGFVDRICRKVVFPPLRLLSQQS